MSLAANSLTDSPAAREYGGDARSRIPPATPLLANFFFSEWHGRLEASIGKKTVTISTIEARLVFKFTYTTYLHT